MKKKLLHLLIPLLAVASTLRAHEQHALIISFHEGDSVAIVLAEKPCATFIEDNLLVETATFSATYLRSAIAGFHFGWYAPDNVGIGTQPQDMVHIVYTDQQHVQVLGIASTSSVTVHSASGHSMAANVAPLSHGIAIDLTAYPTGIYLITINNEQTFKITKQ